MRYTNTKRKKNKFLKVKKEHIIGRHVKCEWMWIKII